MTALQVHDDPALLELMLKDLHAAPESYRPTNYWQYYERRFVPWLREHGLRDLRRQPSHGPAHTFTSMGATDLHQPLVRFARFEESRLLANKYIRRVPGWGEGMWRLSCAVQRWLLPDDQAPAQRLTWEYTRARGDEAGARPLQELSFSMHGNPEDAFEVDGNWYTRAALFYYLQYAYATRFYDFSAGRTYVELGSGGGKQAEILRLAHPEMCLVLFDLPPQLYVAHQFLGAAFPGDVVSYQEVRETEDLSTLVAPGRIILAGSWRFPDVDAIRPDLFWNAASFQEMEPAVVANYLAFVGRSAGAVYLHEMMSGKEVAPRPGMSGVLRPTTLEHYRAGLSNFDLVDVSPTLLPTATELPMHSNAFWRRRQEGAAATTTPKGP